MYPRGLKTFPAPLSLLRQETLGARDCLSLRAAPHTTGPARASTLSCSMRWAYERQVTAFPAGSCCRIQTQSPEPLNLGAIQKPGTKWLFPVVPVSYCRRRAGVTLVAAAWAQGSEGGRTEGAKSPPFLLEAFPATQSLSVPLPGPLTLPFVTQLQRSSHHHKGAGPGRHAVLGQICGQLHQEKPRLRPDAVGVHTAGPQDPLLEVSRHQPH